MSGKNLTSATSRSHDQIITMILCILIWVLKSKLFYKQKVPIISLGNLRLFYQLTTWYNDLFSVYLAVYYQTSSSLMVLVYYIKARQYIYYLYIQYTYYEYALSNIENQYSKCKSTTIYLSPVCFLKSKKRLVLVIFR